MRVNTFTSLLILPWGLGSSLNFSQVISYHLSISPLILSNSANISNHSIIGLNVYICFSFGSLKVFKIVFLSFIVHLGKNRQPTPCHILNAVVLEISSMRSVCPLETQLYSVSQDTQKRICAFLLKLSMNLCLDLRVYWTYISFQRLVSVWSGTHNCDPPYLSWFSVSHFFIGDTNYFWKINCQFWVCICVNKCFESIFCVSYV